MTSKRQEMKDLKKKEIRKPEKKSNVKKVLVTQSCLTLCDPMNRSLPGSSVHGILQARILVCIAMAFSRGSSRPGTEPGSPALQADSLPSEPPGKPA